MIFVTVGTHEQQFNRLIEYMDTWAAVHKEKVVIQIGYSTYIPQFCEWYKLLPYQEMNNYLHEARIVITHGGPSSFISPVQIGKIPIVVPRKREFGEHVNDHQITFSKAVEESMGFIKVVEDIDKLGDAISRYDELIKDMEKLFKSNNLKFCEELENIVGELLCSK